MDGDLPCKAAPALSFAPSEPRAGEEGRGDNGGEKPPREGGAGDNALGGRQLRAGVKRLAGTPPLGAPEITRDGRGAGGGGYDGGLSRRLGRGKVIVGTSSSSTIPDVLEVDG